MMTTESPGDVDLDRELQQAAAAMRTFTAAHCDVRCDQHGRMIYQPDPMWWACPGFDGEGCPVFTPFEAIATGTTFGLSARGDGSGTWHVEPAAAEPDDGLPPL